MVVNRISKLEEKESCFGKGDNCRNDIDSLMQAYT